MHQWLGSVIRLRKVDKTMKHKTLIFYKTLLILIAYACQKAFLNMSTAQETLLEGQCWWVYVNMWTGFVLLLKPLENVSLGIGKRIQNACFIFSRLPKYKQMCQVTWLFYFPLWQKEEEKRGLRMKVTISLFGSFSLCLGQCYDIPCFPVRAKKPMNW